MSQGDVTYIASKRQQDGQLAKCVIRLQELGGSFADEYLCTVFGNLAQCRFAQGAVVVAKLRFQVHESGGQLYQDIVASELFKLK